MPRKWVRERRADAWYKLAKKEGWRTRASFKLLQIDERFSLIHEGDRVVDLGAAPGGWSQVALELVGAEGRVVGVDLDRIEPIEGVTFIRGDMTAPETVGKVIEAIEGVADVVISDMSPNISGAYATDHARSIWLVECALQFAEKVLRPGGGFTCKVFEGDMFPNFLHKARQVFEEVHVHSPKASRSQSSEVYVIALGFRGPRAYPPPRAVPTWKEGDAMPPSRRLRRLEGQEEGGREGEGRARAEGQEGGGREGEGRARGREVGSE